MFSGLGLSLLPLVFSLILTIASRLLHPYSTDDKTSRLMVKRVSTVRDTQRGSQSYMENRRGRREIKVTRRWRGGIKRRVSNLASTAWNTHRGSWSYIEKRRGRRELEVIQIR